MTSGGTTSITADEASRTDVQSVWTRCVTDVQARLTTPASRAWFDDTQAVALSEDAITLRAPNSFAKEWLEQRYGNLLADALRRASGRELRVEILTAPANGGAAYAIPPPPVPQAPSSDDAPTLNP